MNRISLWLVALALLVAHPASASPYYIIAEWQDRTHVLVTWYQQPNVRLTCLERQPRGVGDSVSLGCFENLPVDIYHMQLPPDRPNADYVLWPEEGDVYTVIFWIDGYGEVRCKTKVWERPRIIFYFPIIYN